MQITSNKHSERKRKALIAVILAILALFLILVYYIYLHNNGRANFQNSIVRIGNTEFTVEIADNSRLHYQGLSFRDTLCEQCGMLFIFDQKEKKTFVMRNMRIPLDIIWISENRITGIEKNLLPEGAEYQNYYSSDVPVDRVLEINAGLSDKLGIKAGDTVFFNR